MGKKVELDKSQKTQYNNSVKGSRVTVTLNNY